MLPEAYVAHHAGERLRLRIPARKGDAAYFARAERALAAASGVRYAEANPLTASLLLQYDGPLGDLIAAGQAHSLFALAPPRIATESILDLVTDQVDHVERLVLHSSRGALDLNTLLFVGLVGAGIVQIARGRALGPASALLANAAAVLALHRAQRMQAGVGGLAPGRQTERTPADS
jgi:hypothetical protein